MNCCPCCPRIGKKNKGKLYFIRYSTFFKKLFILSLRLKKVKLTLKNAACCMTAIEKYLRKNNLDPVTKTENIKTDSTKILRPTRFLGPKNIKTDSFFVGLNLSKRWRIRPKI
jgi:hypothetical protein